MTPTQATAAKTPITASQHANPRSDIEIAQAAKKRFPSSRVRMRCT